MGIFDSFRKKQANNVPMQTIEPVETPIEGYKMINLFKNVNVRRMGVIPADTKIGDKVVLMYEPASKYIEENISLLLVPQKKLFGHIDDRFVGKEIIKCVKHSDKSVARITAFLNRPNEYRATIDIAFFKKNK